jgi:hypothetical protein
VVSLVCTQRIDFEIPQGIPVITDLMKSCFSYNPQDRPDASSVNDLLNSLTVNKSGLSALIISYELMTCSDEFVFQK